MLNIKCLFDHLLIVNKNGIVSIDQVQNQNYDQPNDEINNYR